MNPQRLFVASCLSIATASVVFAIRGDIAGSLSQAFHITNEQMGLIFSPAFWAFTMAIFISGSLIDIVGMRRLHVLSAAGFIAGVALIGLAPRPEGPVASLFDHPGTVMLYAGFFMFGLSHGLVEGVINPLMASLYTTEKTRRITSVHAWWPAGLVIGGLLTVAMTRAGIPWQAKLGLVLVPALVYLVMALSLRYPQTERAASNVPAAEMWRQAGRPLFLVLMVCMWMTAATEMGPDQWFPRVMGDLVPQLSPDAGSGVLFLVYTGGLMFVLRIWGSALTHKSPILTMAGSAGLSARRVVLARLARQGLERPRRAAGCHGVRRRQDLPVADDDWHHGRAVPSWRSLADVADGRRRLLVSRRNVCRSWVRGSTAPALARRCRWWLASPPCWRWCSWACGCTSAAAAATARCRSPIRRAAASGGRSARRGATAQPRGGGRRTSRSSFFCGSLATPTTSNSSGVVPVFSKLFATFSCNGMASPRDDRRALAADGDPARAVEHVVEGAEIRDPCWGPPRPRAAAPRGRHRPRARGTRTAPGRAGTARRPCRRASPRRAAAAPCRDASS